MGPRSKSSYIPVNSMFLHWISSSDYKYTAITTIICNRDKINVCDTPGHFMDCKNMARTRSWPRPSLLVSVVELSNVLSHPGAVLPAPSLYNYLFTWLLNSLSSAVNQHVGWSYRIYFKNQYSNSNYVKWTDNW